MASLKRDIFQTMGESAELDAESLAVERKKKTRRAFQSNFAGIDFSKEITLPAKAPRQSPARSDLPCPQVLSDQMDAVQSQVSGEWYESKSALRREYKATGHIEKGNDRRPPWKMPRSSRAEIRETVRKARARVERGERNIHKGK